MNPESLGILLQGVGSVLLACVTAVIGWRAAGALRIRIEGPLHIGPVAPTKGPTEPSDEFADAR